MTFPADLPGWNPRLIGIGDTPRHLIVDVTGYVRRFNSKDGNPRFMLVTSHGSFTTGRDAAFAGEIRNSDNFGDQEEMPNGPKTVILHCDNTNAIWGITFNDIE